MQPLLDGMPRRLYPATPARLATYLDCPRRYRYAYLQRPTPPKGPPWAHNSVGAAVHTALARWWALPRARRTPEAGGELLTRAWLVDGFRDDRQSWDARLRSRTQVERYLADVDPADEPLGVERTVSVRTDHASLWGRADRIDGRQGAAVVVDYKTGRSTLTDEHARDSLALAVYAVAAARTLRRPCTRVELHHLPTGQVLAWDHTEESLSAHLQRADEVAAELDALDEEFADGFVAGRTMNDAFPARVGSRCGWCDFRSVCGPGQSVPKQAPWAGLRDA